MDMDERDTVLFDSASSAVSGQDPAAGPQDKIQDSGSGEPRSGPAISVCRELGRCFLTVSGLSLSEEEYTLQMILHDPIPGTLRTETFIRDGLLTLRYDITACGSLKSRYENVPVRAGDLRLILSCIRDVSVRISQHLLDQEDLLLDPEYMYFGQDSDELLICFIPHLSLSGRTYCTSFAEYLIRRVDHRDAEASALAYSFYDMAASQDPILQDVLTRLLSGSPDMPGRRTESSGRPPQDASVRDLHSQYEQDRSAYRQKITQTGMQAAPPEQTIPQDRKQTPPPRQKIPQDRKRTPPPEQKISQDRKRTPPPQQHTARKKNSSCRSVVLLVLAAAAACAVCTVFFHLDGVQIGGFGFLSTAVIWLIIQQRQHSSGDIHNVWTDEEEDQDDDAFYQSLLKEVYAQDQPSSAAFPGAGEKAYDPAHRASARQEYDPPYRAAAIRQEYDPPYQAASARQEYGRSPCLISLKPQLSPDIPLTSDCVVIGTSPDRCSIVLPADTVSRTHARIDRRNGEYFVTDLFSTNGTTVDGRRLEPGRCVSLKDGSEIDFADLCYRICA